MFLWNGAGSPVAGSKLPRGGRVTSTKGIQRALPSARVKGISSRYSSSQVIGSLGLVTVRVFTSEVYSEE